MASDNFLFNFSKLVKTTQSTSSMAQYSNTLPASQCSNGFPVDKYAGYGVKSSEVLYVGTLYFINSPNTGEFKSTLSAI